MADQKNLTLRVYARIKEMMLNYDIVPGQRLVFVDLAKQLGVSRTPVNNALCILAKEGYLDFVPNQGYSVHKLTREEAGALYEVKEIFELGTIGKAIKKADEKMIRRLQKKKDGYRAAVSTRVSRRMFILDTDFHSAIVDMAGNPFFEERYRDLCQQIFLRFRTEHLEAGRLHEIVKEHDALYEAVCIRDVQWAKELIRQHNAGAVENLFPIIFGEQDISEGIR